MEKCKMKYLVPKKNIINLRKGPLKKAKGSVRLQEIDGMFGFLLDMEGLCFKAETSYLKEPCENFGEAYSCDVDRQELYKEKFWILERC